MELGFLARCLHNWLTITDVANDSSVAAQSVLTADQQ